MKTLRNIIGVLLLSGLTSYAVIYFFGFREVIVQESPTIEKSNAAYAVSSMGLPAESVDFTKAAELTLNAVVHVTTEIIDHSRSNDPFYQFFYGKPMPPQSFKSSGSGVIVSSDGYIVTNNHVVAEADVVKVTLNNNREVKAEVIGTDPDTDLAVIKINEKDLPYLSFVNSDESKVGQWVLAVGNPFNLNSTVTAGIISAKGRDINIINSSNRDSNGQQRARTAIESFIQTDAAINPGNSGGALVDINGGLLGINTAIASPTGSYSGYGFAVPSNIVSKITEDLIAYGTVQRGWLGIEIRNVTSDLAKENDLGVSEGAYVAGFGDVGDKSSAKAAGIKEGDVVVKIDDHEIKSSSALIEYVGQKRPGDKIDLTVIRQGKKMVIPVTLKSREGKTTAVAREANPEMASLGWDLEEADAKLLKRMEITGGVKVSSVLNGKIKRYTDIREGFIITHIDDIAVKSVKEVNEILKKKKAGDLLTIAGMYEDYPREYIFALRM